MTALGNAREYAGGFMYWQSPFRRTEGTQEPLCRLYDLGLLREAATHLVHNEVAYLRSGPGPRTDVEAGRLLMNAVHADQRVFTEVPEWIASELGGDDGD
jgi:hypothetical protein